MVGNISVVLPSYNEKENIVGAITRIEAALEDQLLELIVVDDNSPDRTWKVVSDLNHNKVKLIHRKGEKGLASAIALGLNEARGEIVAWLDCDLGVPPEILKKLLEQLDKYDIAIASRFVEAGRDERSSWIVICSYLINKFAQLLLGSQIKDYTSGVIALRRHVLEKVSINPHGFGEYFIEFIANCTQKGFLIVEVGYSYKDRAAGYSKSTGSLLTFFRLGVQYGIKVLSTYIKLIR